MDAISPTTVACLWTLTRFYICFHFIYGFLGEFLCRVYVAVLEVCSDKLEIIDYE